MQKSGFLRTRLKCYWKNSDVVNVRRGSSSYWGPPRGGGVPVPLFPWNKLACSLVPQISKIWFCMFPVPQYCLCSPVPLKIWPLFLCSPEINALVPLFPKTPGRASVLDQIIVAAILESWSHTCGCDVTRLGLGAYNWLRYVIVALPFTSHVFLEWRVGDW